MDIRLLELPLSDLRLRNQLKQLIPPHLEVCLDGIDPLRIKSAKVLAIAAFVDSIPIGITFASAFTAIRQGEIRCIIVKDEFLNQGIEEKLLHQITLKLTEMNISAVAFAFIDEDPHALHLKNALCKAHWEGPRPHLLEFYFISAEFRPKWLFQEMKMGPEFKIIHWRNLSKNDLAEIEQRIEQRNIPLYVSPFAGQFPIEMGNSVALKYAGTIVGWMVTHRRSKYEIRYAALYLDKEFHQTGLWFALLTTSIRIQIEKMSDITYGSLEINFDQIPLPWKKFVARRLSEHACKMTQKTLFWKSFLNTKDEG
jgi:hypothetical protein